MLFDENVKNKHFYGYLETENNSDADVELEDAWNFGRSMVITKKDIENAVDDQAGWIFSV